MLSNFLSNKYNLFGLSALCYTIIGLIMQLNNFTFSQIFLSFVVMAVGNFVSYLYGMNKGIIFTTYKRPNFIKELDKINEMIREEDNKASNKKSNPSKKKKGCGSGGCKNC